MGEPTGQGSIPLFQPAAGKLEGLQSWGIGHRLGGYGPAEAEARLGHSLVCGQDGHGLWQGQAGLWVLDTEPSVTSVELGLRFPKADMGPWDLHGMGSPRGQAESQGCPQGLGNSAKVPL